MAKFMYAPPESSLAVFGPTRMLWGKEFPQGKPVEVADPVLANKCRALVEFKEVEGDAKPSKAKD